jgi:hypothetical protein
MKTSKLFGLAALSLLLAGTTFAGRTPGGRAQERLSSIRHFESLQAGDQVAVICKMCDTMSIREIESHEDAMALCTEGTEIQCPSCMKTARVVRRGPPSKGLRDQVRFQDSEGNECMFMAKIESESTPTEGAHAHH